MKPEPQFLPQGAFRQDDGNVLFRVWAPFADQVALVTWPEGARRAALMTPAGYGYFTHEESGLAEGARYAYQLRPDGPDRPDPASRWQPDGVHTPSALFDPAQFRWTDSHWGGISRNELVIYELHVGTFTEAGTFDAVIERLPALRELGVTAIEIMPVAQFPGERNWGYDGVHPYAAQNTYGGPHALQRLVDACHREGLAAILDVVYNHFGPEGTYLGEFGPYFTERYHTPWGSAVNYDEHDCDPVRQFVVDNARGWVRDFHFDGLRLDAVQTIFDFSARHLLAELQAAVQEEASRQRRKVHVIAETDQNDTRLIEQPDRGGYGLDGMWTDDFHHSLHTLLTGERQGYYTGYGDPQQLAKSYNEVFVYDGCYEPHRRRRVGSPAGNLDRSSFVVFLKNHDQIGNRAMGDRPSATLNPAQQRLACGLLMLCPCTPLIFMGEEYGETRPFPFFCSFSDDALVEAVRHGRRRHFELQGFERLDQIPDPQSPETYASAKLSWDWPAGSVHGQLRHLYRDLLEARRTWAALKDRGHTHATAVTDSTGASGSKILILHRGPDDELMAVANLHSEPAPLPPLTTGGKHLALSTEDVRYGGEREPQDFLEPIHPFELMIFNSGGSPP